MTIDYAAGIISRWGSTSTADGKLFIFHDCRHEIVPYLHAVDETLQAIDAAASEDELKPAEFLIRTAVSRLADEFWNILKVDAKSSSSLNPNSNTESTTMTDSASSNYEVYQDDLLNLNTITAEAITDLRSIALCMNACGYLHECLKVYVRERKSAIDAWLQRLKVEKLSKNSAGRLEWGVLESKIKIWIKAAKIWFKYFLENEKRLCEQIFQDLGGNTTDSCFMDTITDHTIQLLEIADSLCSIRPASERLFKILDLHHTLSDVLPSINNIFHSPSSEFLRARAANQIIPKLADKANEILLMFDKSLVNEQSPVVLGQPIHGLPKYVMRYVYKLCDHKHTLMSLSPSDLPSMDDDGTVTRSASFSFHVVWIIMNLVTNLEVKSQLCKDPAASHFFAMNNFHYIIQKIQAHSELKQIVAGDGFNKIIEKFELAKAGYLKLTFAVVLKCLRDEGLNRNMIQSFRVLKLTERLKRFNREFEKLQEDLGKLVVPDFAVLDLRKSTVEMLVTPYTSFLVHTRNVARLEKYVKYSVEGIESAIQDFFVCKTKNGDH